MNKLRKIVLSTLITGGILAGLYGTWYGLGKWGYAHINDARVDFYKKHHPEFAFVVEQLRSSPVTMSGFPFRWRFEFDFNNDEVKKWLAGVIKKELDPYLKNGSGNQEEEIVKCLETLRIRKGQVTMGWRSLFSPYPWQMHLGISLDPFHSFIGISLNPLHSFMLSIDYDAGWNMDRTHKKVENLVFSKDKRVLGKLTLSSTLNEEYTLQEGQVSFERVGGDDIKNYFSNFEVALLKNLQDKLLPFHISIKSKIKSQRENSKNKKEEPLSLLMSSLFHYPLGSQAECLMTFNDHALACQLEVGIDKENKDPDEKKVSVQVSVAKRDFLDFLQYAGLPLFFTEFFTERGDKLIFKSNLEK